MFEHFLFFEGIVALIAAFVVLAVTIFAFVNALMYSGEAYEAAGKLTKATWVAILGIGLVLQFVPGLNLVRIAVLIAAFVYLVDVRPALANLRRR